MHEYFCSLNHKEPFFKLDKFSSISGADYYIGMKGECKFENDCLFQEDSDILVLLVGVIFNKNTLITENGGKTWFQIINNLYNLYGEDFFKIMKGSYNGIIYDKIKKKWIVFSNIQSEKPVFFFWQENELIISSSISIIHDILSKTGRKFTLNQDGAYMLLSHGYMLNGYSIYNEIKRLRPGYYLSYGNNSLVEKRYYKFDNSSITNDSEKEIIENIDYLFIEAVKCQYDKDKEYGYKHLVTLSGGLDSRMVAICAHELGYKDQLNLTFSQSSYLEQKIACQIASELKHEWIFKSLDNGLSMYDLDILTNITGGTAMYSYIALDYNVISSLNLDEFGLLHTGQLGDGILSSWHIRENKKPSIQNGAQSLKLIDKISLASVNLQEFENEELFNISNRFLNGANSGLTGILQFTETFSPFYDLDFWEYCLRIPLDLRYEHNIYKKWILEKYPFAAKFIWEKTGAHIKKDLKDRLRLYHYGRAISLNDFIYGVYRSAARKLKLKYAPSLRAMNPFDSWLILNPELNSFFKEYFKEYISVLDEYAELRSDCENLFQSGTALEKIQVLSLLSAIKTFC